MAFTEIPDIPFKETRKKIKNLETGIVYISINAAAKAVGIKREMIKAAADRNGTANGCRWRYV